MIIRVRNLRVAIFLVRNAVVIVVLVLSVRRTVVIGIQLELRIRLIGAAIRVGHRNRNIELLNSVLIQLRPIRERNRNLTSGLINADLIALRSSEVLTNSKLRTLRSSYILTILISKGRGRLRLLTRNNQLTLIRRLKLLVVLSTRLLNRDSDSHLISSAIGVGHNNRNLDLVTRLSILRNGNGDLTGLLVDVHTIRSVLTRAESRTLRSLSGVTILVLELRSRNRYVLTRLTRTILIARLEDRVLVRGLRIGVVFLFLLVRDAVIIVILVLDVRRAVTIGIQLELSIRLIHGRIRVGHNNRNIELLNGVLVQLRPIRERNSDLTSVLINADLIALRSSKALTNSERRTLRSGYVLTILISKGRRRLGLLTRINQLTLILRLVLLVISRLELYKEVWRVSSDLHLAAVTKLAAFLHLQVILVDVIKA